MTQRKILIVDDEVSVRQSLEGWFREDGFAVAIAEDGKAALAKMHEGPFDIVIIDLKMPGMDGMEVFEELKVIKPEIPVIIITAYGSLEIAEDARNKGVADFITKPFRKDTILFTIDRVLELARVKKENLELKKKLEEKSPS